MFRFTLPMLLVFSTSVPAQELVQFQNGQVADADDINANFQTVSDRLTLLEQAGGCSVTQENSGARLTCADGSSAIIANGGKVLVYPEGTLGGVPIIEYNTGDIVAKDANEIVLGKVIGAGNSAQILLREDPVLWGMLHNHAATETIKLTSKDYNYLLFMEEGCTGTPFVSFLRDSRWPVDAGVLGLFVKVDGAELENLLFKSRIMNAGIRFDQFNEVGECENGQFVHEAYLATEYIPAPEIRNAVYPYLLHQLP